MHREKANSSCRPEETKKRRSGRLAAATAASATAAVVAAVAASPRQGRKKGTTPCIYIYMPVRFSKNVSVRWRRYVARRHWKRCYFDRRVFSPEAARSKFHVHAPFVPRFVLLMAARRSVRSPLEPSPDNFGFTRIPRRIPRERERGREREGLPAGEEEKLNRATRLECLVSGSEQTYPKRHRRIPGYYTGV